MPRRQGYISFRSCRPRSPQNHRNSLSQDFKVEPQGPLVNVLHVEFHPFFKRGIASPVDLPETGDARADAEAAAMPVLVKTVAVPNRKRSRSHEAHLSLQNIKELWQLINTGFSRESFYTGFTPGMLVILGWFPSPHRVCRVPLRGSGSVAAKSSAWLIALTPTPRVLTRGIGCTIRLDLSHHEAHPSTALRVDSEHEVFGCGSPPRRGERAEKPLWELCVSVVRSLRAHRLWIALRT